jgi:hypothetical protein
VHQIEDLIRKGRRRQAAYSREQSEESGKVR